ncbi:hypothetical protein C8J57DRAFT_1503243 [Mycena rebaudengoi]|nr:hypothetical protein C8J57DRAFT_1503243 [Mycena rebaudengoi]
MSCAVCELSLISTFLQALDQVTYLALPTLDSAALEHLGSLASLRSLQIANGDVRDLSPGIIWLAGFPSLTNLNFYQAPFEFIGTFIHCLSNSPVARVYFGTDSPTESAMRALCLTLSTHIAHSALVDVVMKIVHNDTSDVRDIFDIHTISPLFCFGNIQKLVLEAPGGFKLDDAAVWDIAGAFPELRQLTLGSSTEITCAPGVTLGGLRAFATHCPHLGSMRIAFNATVIPPTATPDIFQTTLSSLEVLNSPISSKPMRVARFLSGIFPSLVKVISDPYDVQPGFNAEDCKTWNRVETLLPLFADVKGLPSCENLNIPSILFFEGLRDPSLPLYSESQHKIEPDRDPIEKFASWWALG